VVVAAELTQQANDVQQLAPMLAAIRTTMTAAGICEPLQRLAADSGYWSIANVSAIPEAPELLIPPARHGRHGKPRKDGKPSESKSDSLRAAMQAKLDSTQGRACYAQRSRTIELLGGVSGLAPPATCAVIDAHTGVTGYGRRDPPKNRRHPACARFEHDGGRA
jgi:hypothetical protein